jgi:hypothetical protein
VTVPRNAVGVVGVAYIRISKESRDISHFSEYIPLTIVLKRLYRSFVSADTVTFSSLYSDTCSSGVLSWPPTPSGV